MQVLNPITINELRVKAPAVFADKAHEDCSTRYGFASSVKVLTELEKQGFVVVSAQSYTKRAQPNAGYAKHVLRLRKAGDIKALKVGDVVPQVVMVNSHDRSSHLELYAGAYRLACSNGLLVSTKEFIEPLVVRHTNRIIEDVMANVGRIASDVGRVSDIIEQMTKTKLSDKAQVAFARQALDLRFGNAGRGAIEPASLLVPRRAQDDGADVWRVYNRVQENMMKGGIASVTAAGRRTTTKPVMSVNSDLHINAGLWELAMGAINKAKATSKAKK